MPGRRKGEFPAFGKSFPFFGKLQDCFVEGPVYREIPQFLGNSQAEASTWICGHGKVSHSQGHPGKRGNEGKKFPVSDQGISLDPAGKDGSAFPGVGTIPKILHVRALLHGNGMKLLLDLPEWDLPLLPELPKSGISRLSLLCAQIPGDSPGAPSWGWGGRKAEQGRECLGWRD